MARNITANMITALAGPKVDTIFYLLDIGFSTAIYLTTANKIINWGSNNYQPNIGLLKFPAIKNSATMTVSTLDMTLSGANLANISSALNENSTDVEVILRLAVYTGGAVVADPLILYTGYIDTWSVTNDHTKGLSLIEWTLRNHLAQTEKVSGRRANYEESKKFFPNDKGFEFASEIAKDVKWGKV